MYYLSEFAGEYQQRDNGLVRGLKKIPRKIFEIPFVNQQLSDLGKEKFLRIVSTQKPTFRQKIKIGKKYLKYRKYLGDTYGKEKGMSILNNQKNHISNIFKPSYAQIPMGE